MKDVNNKQDTSKIAKSGFKLNQLVGDLDRVEELIKKEYQAVLDLKSEAYQAKQSLSCITYKISRNKLK